MSVEQYNTKQKARIEALLEEAHDRHMTAEEICRALSESGTPVGLSTVYRTLERLCEAGIVYRYESGDRGSACFQYGGAKCEHFHLRCVRCGALFHADCDFLKKLSEHVENEHGFLIDHSRTVFYGLCASCRRNEKKAGVSPFPFSENIRENAGGKA